MTELLLANEKKDINSTVHLSSSFSNYSIDFDGVYDALNYANPKSCYKKPLIKTLARLYRYQISIIILSFIIGFIFFAMPMVLIFTKVFDNFFSPLLIPCLFGIIFSLIFIVVPCVDSKRKKYMLSAKTERKNICKNICNLLLFIIITISAFFAIIFYNDILNDKDKKIRFDYEHSYDSQVLSSDFLFKYIIYILLYDNNNIEKIKNFHIRMIFDDSDINNLRYDFLNICIPLLILSFFELLKIFLIQVRQTVERSILFGSIFIFLFFQCFINSYGIENLKEKKLTLASIFEVVVIAIILIGYLFWNVNYSLLFIKKRKDKNFAIRRYKDYFIFIVICIDIITCLGYCIITIGILYCFHSFYYKYDDEGEKEEKFYYLNISFIIFKIGIFPVILGNSYYFGYYFLSIIFRPLSIEYAPYELKNNHYVKARRKLANFMLMKVRRKSKSTINETIKKIFN